MIMNLNSQGGPLVEPFFHANHELESLPGGLFSSTTTAVEHESPPMLNYDLSLTPPSSNNGATPTSNHTFLANGAILHNSIHHPASVPPSLPPPTSSHPSSHPSTLHPASHPPASTQHHPLPLTLPPASQESPLTQFFNSSPEMLSPPLKSQSVGVVPGTPTNTLTTFDLDRNTFLATTPISQTIDLDRQGANLHSDQQPQLHQLQPSHRNMKLISDDFHDERICFGCRESLNTSRFILSVSGYHNWHTDCLSFSECGQSLCSSSTCYIHNGRMYCRADYQRLNECCKCHRTIGSTDWVRRAGDRLYHLACFACDLCQRQLSTGENFTVMRHSKNDTRLLCKLHFSVGDDEERKLSELDVRTHSPQPALQDLSQAPALVPTPNHPSGLLVSTPQSAAPSSVPHPVPPNGQISAGSRSSSSSQQSGPTSVSSSSGTSGGGSKTKRVRTTFTEDQLSVLQANFQIDSNPDGQDLERIAALTGLSKRVTQVWFQNSRARQKKYMSKSARSGGSGQSPNLMLSLRPGTGASGASSTSGLWSPTSSTGSASPTHQMSHPLAQQVGLPTHISLPIHGANIKWRTNVLNGTNMGDDESLDVSPEASISG